MKKKKHPTPYSKAVFQFRVIESCLTRIQEVASAQEGRKWKDVEETAMMLETDIQELLASIEETV